MDIAKDAVVVVEKEKVVAFRVKLIKRRWFTARSFFSPVGTATYLFQSKSLKKSQYRKKFYDTRLMIRS